MLFTLVVVGASAMAGQGGNDSAEPLPALFNVIKAEPASMEGIVRLPIVNHDGDGEGEEMPSTIQYSIRNSKDFSTFMAVTNLGLCIRPVEKEICASFVRMISGAPPAVGTDISQTRIGGAGYGTVYLAPLHGFSFAGVDAFAAFLSIDSQDSPQGDIVMYVYAKKGNDLIQINGRAASCDAPVKPGQSDAEYYRRHCLGKAVVEKAEAEGKKLIELFRLKP